MEHLSNTIKLKHLTENQRKTRNRINQIITPRGWNKTTRERFPSPKMKMLGIYTSQRSSISGHDNTKVITKENSPLR